jgi:hypothetical protein
MAMRRERCASTAGTSKLPLFGVRWTRLRWPYATPSMPGSPRTLVGRTGGKSFHCGIRNLTRLIAPCEPPSPITGSRPRPVTSWLSSTSVSGRPCWQTGTTLSYGRRRCRTRFCTNRQLVDGARSTPVLRVYVCCAIGSRIMSQSSGARSKRIMSPSWSCLATCTRTPGSGPTRTRACRRAWHDAPDVWLGRCIPLLARFRWPL